MQTIKDAYALPNLEESFSALCGSKWFSVLDLKTLKELKSFLGFAGYYRRFIRGYATIAKPLNHLTRGYVPKRKASSNRSTASYDLKQPFGERWTPECQHAFETLINCLTSAPVLGFADPKRPYILHTDASTTGLGAALYQEQDGHLRAIAYASRGLSSSESKYPAHKLEFLALKWSITEKFHDYLYGASFVVVTDNNPLTYVLTSAKLDAASHRWLGSTFHLHIYTSVPRWHPNQDADALSRRPHDTSHADSCTDADFVRQFTQEHLGDPVCEIAPDIVEAICKSCLIRSCLPGLDSISLVESLSMSVQAIPDSYTDEKHHGLPLVPLLSLDDLRDKQRADPVIRDVLHQLETGEQVPPTVRKECPELSLLLREFDRLELVDAVLYRKRQEGDHVQLQLVLPEELRSMVLTSLHDDMGHMGVDRTLDLVRSRFFWPRMSFDVETKIRTCDRCPDFESKLIKELCDLSGIEKTRTTPYHPRGNPVERFNRTLLGMLGTLQVAQKKKWKEFVKPLVHAYNCTKNEVTGFTPYELMFGRSPRLPVDLAFSLPVKEPQTNSHSQYVANLRSRLEYCYQLASKSAEKSAARNKSRFDRRVTPSCLEAGDRVLVRNVRLRGKHKLEDKWESDVYVVLRRAGDLPVYTVRSEKHPDAPCRTLHRDLLLPCGFLPVDLGGSSPQPSPARRPVTRSQRPVDSVVEQLEDEEEEWGGPYVVAKSPQRFRVEHIVPVDGANTRTLHTTPTPILTESIDSLSENLPDPESVAVEATPSSLPVELSESNLHEDPCPQPEVPMEDVESSGQAETSLALTEPEPNHSVVTENPVVSPIRWFVVLPGTDSRLIASTILIIAPRHVIATANHSSIKDVTRKLVTHARDTEQLVCCRSRPPVPFGVESLLRCQIIKELAWSRMAS
ncbi:hypothetical protein WMY93_029567 [Mugilogobius chulae]|uniref:Gypsy retrotransposon integrase-like protein 1 n=1 Tax=Mugilogobius chulae TaxID=88201 RepID=A0AAW0MXF4_9GOBI